jgi:hypothetical protein
MNRPRSTSPASRLWRQRRVNSDRVALRRSKSHVLNVMLEGTRRCRAARSGFAAPRDEAAPCKCLAPAGLKAEMLLTGPSRTPLKSGRRTLSSVTRRYIRGQFQRLGLDGKISDISSVSSVGSDLAAAVPWRSISDGMPADAVDCSMERGCHQRKKAVAISEAPKMANARMLERFIVNLVHRAGDEVARSVLQKHCSSLLLSYICTAPDTCVYGRVSMLL